MSKNTMVELVKELEKLSDTNIKDKMIKLAKKGAFHDYRSKSTCGKMYFIECANWCYRNNMPESDKKLIKTMEDDIKNGEYDEVYTEEDSKIVLAEMEKDATMSEKDKVFFRKQMAWTKPKNNSPFGKKYF